MKNGLFAVINIGTSAFRVEIGSFINGEYRELEYLVKSLSLGKDTFSKGFISSKSIKEAYDILKIFKTKMNEYKIGSRFSIVATSGVREAKNREFFVDYIDKKLGMKIQILTPHEELYIRYIGIKNEFKQFGQFEKNGVALVNVSSGNVSIVIVKNRTILYANSLHFGSLRLNEVFNDVEDKDKIYAYDRYIKSMIGNVERVISGSSIKNIIFSGSSINILKKILFPKQNHISKAEIFLLHDKIKKEGVRYIEDNFPIRKNEAAILKPVIAIYTSVLGLFEFKLFYFSKTTFPRKLLMHYSRSYKIGNLKDYLENTILNIGDKYSFDKNHALCVRKIAIKLFDVLHDVHLLDKKYKKFIEIASLLHDVGYYVNEENHEEHSYYIIKSLHLPEIDEDDSRIIALIALLHKEKERGVYLKLYDNYLSREDMFTLTKLSSLLRIADAMDASHRQLIKDFDINIGTCDIVINAKSNSFIYFEMTSVQRKSRLFEDTFGIKVKLEHVID